MQPQQPRALEHGAAYYEAAAPPLGQSGAAGRELSYLQQRHQQQFASKPANPMAHSSSLLSQVAATSDSYLAGMSSDSELSAGSSSARNHARPHSSQARVYHAHPAPRPLPVAATATEPTSGADFGAYAGPQSRPSSSAGPPPTHQRQLPARPFKQSMSVDQHQVSAGSYLHSHYQQRPIQQQQQQQRLTGVGYNEQPAAYQQPSSVHQELWQQAAAYQREAAAAQRFRHDMEYLEKRANAISLSSGLNQQYQQGSPTRLQQQHGQQHQHQHRQQHQHRLRYAATGPAGHSADQLQEQPLGTSSGAAGYSGSNQPLANQVDWLPPMGRSLASSPFKQAASVEASQYRAAAANYYPSSAVGARLRQVEPAEYQREPAHQQLYASTSEALPGAAYQQPTTSSAAPAYAAPTAGPQFPRGHLQHQFSSGAHQVQAQLVQSRAPIKRGAHGSSTSALNEFPAAAAAASSSARAPRQSAARELLGPAAPSSESTRSESSTATAPAPTGSNGASSHDEPAGLAKKSNSATQLSMSGTKKRLGFRKKQVTSFSVHRSEEVGAAAAAAAAAATGSQLVKQASSVSEGESSLSGDSSSRSWSNSNFKQQNSDEAASMSFIDGLGRGQMISRQGLASPYLGDIQLSLCDRRGNLEVEVIRARNLQAKAHKILPLTYVKLYLVKNRKCLAKAKTALCSKRTLDPLFQQQLTFHEDYHGSILQSIVWGNFGKMDKKNFMGIAQISIDDLDLADTVLSWYKLFLPSSLQTLPSKSLRHTLLSNSTESFTTTTTNTNTNS